MAFTLVSAAEAHALSDALTARALSIKADGIAQVSPGDGGIQISGFDRTNSLQRHIEVNVNGALIIGNTGGDVVTGAFDNAVADETKIGLFVRAALTGQDLNAAVNSKNTPISADLVTNINNRAAGSIEALYTASVAMAVNPSSGNPINIHSSLALTAQAYTTQRLMTDAVVRGDDGATYSAVGARNATTAQATSLIRLLCDQVIRGYEANTNGTYTLISSALDTVPAIGGSLLITESRARGYWSSLRGRRYVVKSPNLTGVALATSFVATTPTILLDTGATKAIVVRRITLTIKTVNGATSFEALVKVDNVNRYSAGGTNRSAGTFNQGNTVATGLAKISEAPTALAESAAVDVASQDAAITLGTKLEFLFEDGLIVTKSGSLLVYGVSATAAMTVNYEVEFEEAQVQ